MPEAAEGVRAPRAVVAAFWVCAVFFMFWNLGGGSLRDWDEGLSAERAREMLTTGNFVSPQLQYEPDFNKPPLYYQLTAAAFAVLGKSEFAARMWSALFSLGCAAACWRLAERESGDWRAGLLAGVLLVGSAHWVNQTRQGLLDSGMMLGTLGFILGATTRGGGRRAALAAGVFGAFATLVKGPLWLLVAPVCAWFAWRGEAGAGLRRVALASGIALALSAPWYVVQTAIHGTGFVQRHAAYNYVARVTRDIEGHERSPLVYVTTWGRRAPVSAAGVLAALALAAAVPALRRRLANPAMISAAVMLAVLSLSSSRRELYLVWVLPLAAAGTAPVLAEALSTGRALAWRNRVLLGGGVAALVVLAPGWQREIKGDRHLKAVAEAIRKSTPGSTVICSWEHPVQVPMFYAHRVAYVGDATSAPPLRTGLRKSERPAVLLVKAKRLADARATLEEAEFTVGSERADLASGDWRVYDLKP